MIPPDTIAQLRDRTDIVKVIQETVPSLKKRGRSFSGLCPFHKEKSPSFHVNPDRGFFKCFGCGEAGDVFTFLMKEFSYTFTEAAHVLAERAGIVIEVEARERTDVDRAKKQKDDLYAANALAAAWFEEQLVKHPLRSFALEELARRGIVPGAKPEVDAALKAFRVGYAPDGWDGLANFFRQQGISPVAAESVGLLAPRSSGSGHYDRFRHRLMFAVVDTQGRVVAFSGRALAEPPDAEIKPGADKPAKYINSKESPIYTKGNVLFGLFQARHAIRDADLAIVVEGNFDVFSLHARGLAHVVAPLGTAFTPEQATLLKRYAPTAVLLFDGDAAGRKAARASRMPCMDAGLVAKVASLPDGEDPDDYARKRGIPPLLDLVVRAKGMLEFLIDAELDESFVAADAHERLARVDRIAQLIASEDDPLVRMMAKGYADSVAGRLDLVGTDTFRALEQKIRAAARAPRATPDVPVRPRPADPSAAFQGVGGRPDREPEKRRTAQKTPGAAERRDIVGALLEYPSLLSDREVQAACVHLEGPAALTIAALRKAWNPEKGLDTSGFLAQIPAAIKGFASDRLASPAHETEKEAKEALLKTAQQLERLILAHENGDTAREMNRPSEHVEQERLMRELQERRERQLLGITARVVRASESGATPHEERPFEQAANEDGRSADEGDGREPGDDGEDREDREDRDGEDREDGEDFESSTRE